MNESPAKVVQAGGTSAAAFTVPSQVPGLTICVQCAPRSGDQKSACWKAVPGPFEMTSAAYSALLAPLSWSASRMFSVWPAAQPRVGPTAVWALTHVVAVPNLVPPMAVQLAPMSVLRNTPAPETPMNSQLVCAGSPIRSNESPAGRPDEPSPETRVKVDPVLVLRQTPPPAPPAGSCVPTTMRLPRAWTPVMRRPASVLAPRPVHDFPPSVERRTSLSTLPTGANVGRSRKLLTGPAPATSVWFALSVASSARARIELGPMLSSGVQLAPLLTVCQMPPLTVPTQIVAALPGSGRTTLTAPSIGRLGMPSSWPPVAPAGPWATKFGAPNGTTSAVTVEPLLMRSVTRKPGMPGWWLKPGVRPAATAAPSTATCTSFASWAKVVCVLSCCTRTLVSEANALVLVSLPASPTRASTCLRASAPVKCTV